MAITHSDIWMLDKGQLLEYAQLSLPIPMGLTNQQHRILVLESSPVRYILSDS